METDFVRWSRHSVSSPPSLRFEAAHFTLILHFPVPREKVVFIPTWRSVGGLPSALLQAGHYTLELANLAEDLAFVAGSTSAVTERYHAGTAFLYISDYRQWQVAGVHSRAIYEAWGAWGFFDLSFQSIEFLSLRFLQRAMLHELQSESASRLID